MPTGLLKDCADIVAQFFTKLFNRCLRLGSVPTVFKEAYIMPLIKKADLDVDDVRSYRSISTLSVLSKLLECLVSRQHLRPHWWFCQRVEQQSATVPSGWPGLAPGTRCRHSSQTLQRYPPSSVI